MEAKVGDYRLRISYDRIYDSVESVISNTSNNIYGVALNKDGEKYVKYNPHSIPCDLDDDEIDIRDIADYCHSQGLAKLVRVIEYQSGENAVSEVNDAYKASLMLYVDHKYDGYDAELGYVFKDVKNYIEGNNVMVMPQKYVEWTSTDKQVMTEWENICTAWMGFVIPIEENAIEQIIESIVGDGIIHPSDDEIAKMRKAFLNSDNHYYDDY